MVNSFYFMNASISACFGFFAWKIISKQRRSQIDLPMFFLLTGVTGYSGYYNNAMTKQLEDYLTYDNSKFKNINITEYKRSPQFYIRYLLDDE